MNQSTLPRTSLFDLLARSWTLGAAATEIRFDARETAVAFAMADGRVALMPTADPEAPDLRIRIELDSGRTTIKPREAAPAAPILTESFGAGAVPFAVSGEMGFVLADAEGAVLRLTPRGQVLRLIKGQGAAITALATHPASRRIALAGNGAVLLCDEAASTPFAARDADCDGAGLTFSPDGRQLALAGPGGVTLWATDGDADPQHYAIRAASAPVFSADGAFLAGTDTGGGLWLLETATGRQGRIGDYPAPPRSIAFSAAVPALLTSGAYRVAGWSMANPSLDGAAGGAPGDHAAQGALRTGKPGLVLVEAVATHPGRDLVAAGFGNGIVTVARIGQADEMLLRPDATAPVTTLAWSPSGNRLAVAGGDGFAALAELPKQLFK